MGQHFEQHELRVLDDCEEIEIEILREDTQEPHRATLWVVVVGNDAYVRSVNGADAHWYQHLIGKLTGTIHANDKHIPIRAVPVDDAEMRVQVSEAYQRKYVLYPQDVAWIVGPEVQRTTLRLEPKLDSRAE
ncbi:MAG: DUF2255 family protein [Steroidobacteraceae bacterium]|jgi:hypothetical protein